MCVINNNYFTQCNFFTMMKNRFPFLFGIICLLGFSNFGKSDLIFDHQLNAPPVLNTAGSLSFQVRTVTANGNFEPRHVMAVWIEDANGFVITNLLRAQARKQYLYTWKSATNQNVVDAITGATISSHQTHTINWNGKDVTGSIVPDGDYTIRVEFTEEHAQGPLASFIFTKGTSMVHLTPANLSNFKDIVVDWTPETVSSTADILLSDFSVFPNPAKEFVDIEVPFKGNFKMQLTSISGQVFEENSFYSQLENSKHQIDVSQLPAGLYLLSIRSEIAVWVKKLVVQ